MAIMIFIAPTKEYSMRPLLFPILFSFLCFSTVHAADLSKQKMTKKMMDMITKYKTWTEVIGNIGIDCKDIQQIQENIKTNYRKEIKIAKKSLAKLKKEEVRVLYDQFT